jgi:hypothetical protein
VYRISSERRSDEYPERELACRHKPMEDFKQFTDVFEDKQGRKINSFVAFCHGDRQQAIYVAGQAPPLKFGPAFGGKSFLTWSLSHHRLHKT